MVTATVLNQAQSKPIQFGSSTQFNPVQSVKVANAAVLYNVADYALFEAAAALYVLATGKPDPRQTANSTAKSMMRPYTAPEAKLFADGLREAMQKYPDASKAPKGFVAKLEKWKAAAYKANEPNVSLQLFAGEYIKDQKLLTDLHSLQANPKASKAQRIEAQSLVMMAQGRENGWQKRVSAFFEQFKTSSAIIECVTLVRVNKESNTVASMKATTIGTITSEALGVQPIPSRTMIVTINSRGASNLIASKYRTPSSSVRTVVEPSKVKEAAASGECLAPWMLKPIISTVIQE